MTKIKKVPDFTLIVDSREQNAYTFSYLQSPPKIIYKGLKTADYSIEGYEDKVGIERKTLQDLYGSTGRGRERLQREFERMADFEYAALIIEGGLGDIFKRTPTHSQMNPKAVFRTLISWSLRYKVFVWPCPDRAFSERLTYLLLEKFYIEATEKI